MTSEQTIEKNMYGCTIADMRESFEDSTLFEFGQLDVLVMSILSDAQEMVAYGTPSPALLNQQRQTINRAKWAMREYLIKETV